MAPALSNPNPIEEEEKLYPTNTTPVKHRRLQRRRRFIIVFAFFALALLLFARPPETIATPFSTVITTVKSWFSCHTETDMSTLPKSTTTNAAGWHARAVEHAKTSTDAAYVPKKEDLVVSVLINSPVEPEGFTMALFKPSHVVDASGRVLNIASSDYEAFETLVDKIKELPSTGSFGGQWRVKHARTSYPIDRILIPGHAEVGVYGWSKDADELEEETQGYTNLPKELQTFVGLAKEAREGYTRGHRDEAVVSQVLAFSN
ncbi:SubName: Full=Uncharacterized protein {ECO:0000313/EMBL:CCA71966.1} [Serendipita indica DSM 11827]|uniref:Uncharacterized protein n=1 Tax=Serendipita indica (strain DSM 11827) TaxID=1109443 RepID=G4TKX3_SERID|nr:SubName: Full=Uncharacterized protein {ECO:0000313/EMBL:CCA71966.1} [Serendipita indica DSM 11827]CCA71966.1 hypothetical protein PIIN_05901 [Serendipita indica DSM 11827]